MELIKKLGMELFFAYRHASKFLHVGMIVFDGSGHTCPRYLKSEPGNIFAVYKEKGVATALVFYYDAKHSDILWGSSHVHCYLFSC